MPRKYMRKAGARSYKDYTEEALLQAINDCRHESVKDVAERTKIPFRTLWNKVKGHHKKACGGQTALSEAVEEELMSHLLICSDYGMPLDKRDIRLIVSSYLQRNNQTVSKFKNNIPGDDWIASFLKRHDVLTNRMCQNIKRARAEVTPEDIQKYFTNLKSSLENVPISNILNYDETNLADEPGAKKCIFRRRIKYPERIMNFSKGNISIMFAGTANGTLLPPFVVYKAQHLWESWCSGGPDGARYARSKSGWMDVTNFEEWFLTIVVPWARRLEGPKVIIGDNLSSHLSPTVIEKCENLNIRFVLLVLPPNSTDKCQPLDVSFFGPMKREWRKLMEDYKIKNPTSTSLDKSKFPSLLNKLIISLGMKVPQNLISGFRACGIAPFNMGTVLRKFPSATQEAAGQHHPAQVSPAVLEYLQRFKYSPGAKQTQRTCRKKLPIEPGKSISAKDLTSASSSSSKTPSAASSSVSTPQQAQSNSDSGSSNDPDSDSAEENYNSGDEWQPPSKRSKF